jgi:hypothetical protein
MEQWCAQLIVGLQPNLFNGRKHGLVYFAKMYCDCLLMALQMMHWTSIAKWGRTQ